MAKPKKRKGKNTAAETPAIADDGAWRARDDLHTIQRANEIIGDGKRFGAAKSEAKRQKVPRSHRAAGGQAHLSRRDRIREVCGIPVEFDPESDIVADVRGLFRPRIVVGPLWLRLPEREKMAVCYHEAGHIVHRHLWKRLALIPLLLVAPYFVIPMGRRHEREADEFAARHGYAAEFVAHLKRYLRRPRDEEEEIFYDPVEERIAALLAYSREAPCSSD